VLETSAPSNSASSAAFPAVRNWFRANSPAAFAVGVIGLLVVIALVGPLLVPYGGEEVLSGARLLPPSWAHPFGTDINQMDVFSRVLIAARLDLAIVFGSAALAFIIGFPLGVVSGYYTNLAVKVFLRILDSIQALPILIVALAIVAIAGSGTVNVVYAASFVMIPPLIRVVRAATVSLREERMVEAAVATGNTDLRIIRRHISPHAVGTALAQSTINISAGMRLVTGLSFIGAGINAPTAEWGSMVQVGSSGIVTGHWWVVLFPGLAITLSVLSFNILGNLMQELYGVESAAVR